jgi:hypothetical protein
MEAAALPSGTAAGVEHDVPGWQQAFDASEALFAPLADGARASSRRPPPGRRRAGPMCRAARRGRCRVRCGQGRIAVTIERFES